MGFVVFFAGAILLALVVLADFVVVLIIVRAIYRWRAVPVLAEFDHAGKPLVDRTLRRVSKLWNRLLPNRPLDGWRLLVAACIAVSALRILLQTVLRLTLI